jgi:hypothetical protein
MHACKTHPHARARLQRASRVCFAVAGGEQERAGRQAYARAGPGCMMNVHSSIMCMATCAPATVLTIWNWDACTSGCNLYRSLLYLYPGQPAGPMHLSTFSSCNCNADRQARTFKRIERQIIGACGVVRAAGHPLTGQSQVDFKPRASFNRV